MGQHATLQNNNSDHHPLTGYAGTAKQDEAGGWSMDVLVDGVHCAACIQKIESRLKQSEGVTQARVNFSSRRLTIQWQGLQDRANEFVRVVTGLGYPVKPYTESAAGQSALQEEKFLLQCLGVSGFAMGNIMLLSIALWITTPQEMGQATRDFMHWLSAAIALPAVAYSGLPFFKSALRALAKGESNMDVPISVGVLLSCAISLFETLRHGAHVYYDSAVMLIFFLLLGRYFDLRARRHARSAATDLLKTFSGFAQVIEEGRTRPVLIRDVQAGMQVRVAMGEAFPVDGDITEGQSDVDTSLVTGESRPRPVHVGDTVFAGTLNLSAPVTMVVAKAAENSLLADIVRLMESAGQSQAKYVRIADRVARFYTPVVHILALAAFVLWWGYLNADWPQALLVASTVLIVTCPCALGLAVPVVQVLATGRLMKNGILVKSGDALERLATIDKIVLDKTGTLTLGTPALVGVYSSQALLQAASLAAHSTHPLSKAITKAFDGALLSLTAIQEFPGQGIEAYQGQTRLQLGRRAWCGDVDAPRTDHQEVWLRVEGEPPQRFIFEDKIRSDAKDTIAQFQKQGVQPTILSGDHQLAVQTIAQEVGITDYQAALTPPQKFAVVEQFKNQGHRVLMVGDGLNDAPSLAAATVSIAPGTAIDMAQNAADIVFMGDQFSPVHQAYDVARLSQILVKENFVISIVYNLIAIPLAFGGLMTPLLAAIAMSSSSLIVIGNSFRIQRKP